MQHPTSEHDQRFFNPRSIALVGATERSLWSRSVFENIQRFEFDGAVHLVNPKGGEIYGRPAATSCSAVGEPIDAAIFMAPAKALPDVIADAVEAGVAGAVVLSSGFAEMGEDGARRQGEVAAAAKAGGLRLLGPNCLGYVNYLARAPLWGTPLQRPLADPTVAVISQSGATAAQIAQFARQQRIGLTHMVSTGNEAGIDVADAIAALVDQDAVKSIALFMETARRPAAFITAVEKAHAAGKPVVVLKVGASEGAAKAAEAHTGSLVGDDGVFNAVCRRLGAPRVDSIEELVVTADLIARTGPMSEGGLALAGISGGMCEIATDEAERRGVPIAPLQPGTLSALRKVLPGFATAANPLDITGGAMMEPEFIEKATPILAGDPGVGLVSFLFDAPPDGRNAKFARPFFTSVGEGFAAADIPAVMFSHALTPVTKDARALCEEVGVIYSGAGLSLGVAAIGHLMTWSRVARARPSAPTVPARSDARPTGEREVLAHLCAHGVPTIPGAVTTSEDEAVAHAQSFGDAVVLKIASDDIAHKTDVGGVALNIAGADAVRIAWTEMMGRVTAAKPDARIDGVIVSPMRAKGVELFVGVVRDPQWGPVIAVGLGGLFVELLKDTSQRLLPVSPADVLDMFDELAGAALLDGFRGAPALDRGVAAEAVAAIGNAALALGDDLAALEVNPLLGVGDRVEALDGLAIWADDTG